MRSTLLSILAAVAFYAVVVVQPAFAKLGMRGSVSTSSESVNPLKNALEHFKISMKKSVLFFSSTFLYLSFICGCINKFEEWTDPCCDIFITVKICVFNEKSLMPISNAIITERIYADGVKKMRYSKHKTNANGKVELSVSSYIPRKYLNSVGLEVKIEKEDFDTWKGFFKESDSVMIYLKPAQPELTNKRSEVSKTNGIDKTR